MDLELEHPASPGEKRCPRCGLVKPREEFVKNRASKDGLGAYCRPCHNEKMKEVSDRLYGGHKNYLRQKRYGVSETAVGELLVKQGGVCAICGTPNPTHVDHSHGPDKAVRGLLCFSCNRGLGKAEDDIGILQAAIQYLREHTPPSG